MAGFFYLGGRENNNKQDHQHQVDKSNYLYLYKDEIYNNNKGFEIWPQQEQENEQEQHVSSTPTNFYSFASSSNRSRSLYFNFHEQPLLRSTLGGGLNGGVNGGFTVTRQGGMNCQDCGNQAKKDCQHMRCRTCCKSRGFHCHTHVKSTWVPAAKRRERLAQLSSLQNSRNNATATATAASSAAAKRHREADDHRDGTASAPVVNPNSNSGLELVSHHQNLPPEVSSPAVFRCVRVSSMEEDEDEEEYAYQTAVNIGGHVFKGLLYNQGPDNHHYCYTTSSPAMAETSQHNHHLNLLASTATNTTANAVETGAKRSVSSNNGLILEHNSSVYSAPMNSYISGTQFFPHPRS